MPIVALRNKRVRQRTCQDQPETFTIDLFGLCFAPGQARPGRQTKSQTRTSRGGLGKHQAWVPNNCIKGKAFVFSHFSFFFFIFIFFFCFFRWSFHFHFALTSKSPPLEKYYRLAAQLPLLQVLARRLAAMLNQKLSTAGQLRFTLTPPWKAGLRDCLDELCSADEFIICLAVLSTTFADADVAVAVAVNVAVGCCFGCGCG